MEVDFSRRRLREFKTILGLLFGIFVTTWFVANLLHRAWLAEEAGYQAVQWLIDVSGTDLSTVVTFSTGIAVGWLLLLLFDRSRRIQRLAYLLILVLFYGSILLLGFFQDTQWLADFPWLLLGSVLAIVVALPTVFVTGKREFPLASAGIHTLVVLVVGVGSVDVFVVEGTLGEAVGTSLTSTVATVAMLVSSFLFLFLSAALLQSKDHQQVTIVSPHDGSERVLAVGLVNHIQASFANELVSGYDATANVDWRLEDHRPEPLDETITIRYKSSEPVARWVSVSAHGADITEFEVPAASESGSRPVRTVRSVLGLLVKPYVESIQAFSAEPPEGRFRTSLENADAVLFVASARDFLPADIDGASSETARERVAEEAITFYDTVRPNYLEDMARIRYHVDAETVLFALTDGDLLRQVHENDTGSWPEIDDDGFRRNIRGLVDDVDVDDVIVVETKQGDRSSVIRGDSGIRERLEYGS